MKRLLFLLIATAVVAAGFFFDDGTRLVPPSVEERVVQNLTTILRATGRDVVVDGALPRRFSNAAAQLKGNVRELALYGLEKPWEPPTENNLAALDAAALVHLLPADEALIVIFEAALVPDGEKDLLPHTLAPDRYREKIDQLMTFTTPASFVHYHVAAQSMRFGVLTVLVEPYDPKILGRRFFLSRRQERNLTRWHDGPTVGGMSVASVLFAALMVFTTLPWRRWFPTPSLPAIPKVRDMDDVPRSPVLLRAQARMVPRRPHPHRSLLDNIEQAMGSLGREQREPLAHRLDEFRGNRECALDDITALHRDIRTAVEQEYQKVLAAAAEEIGRVPRTVPGADRDGLERELTRLRRLDRPRLPMAQHLLQQAREASGATMH